jgi:hypothetical protein
VAPLPRRELTRWTQPPRDEGKSDVGEAMKILKCLHFDDENLAHRHASFLVGETKAVLGGKRAGRMIMTLADALMAEQTLSAGRWRGILAAVR